MSSQTKKRKSPTIMGDEEKRLKTLEPSDPSGLLQTFQKDIDDIRAFITCGVCVRPLYEPYTIECGHTFCYTCLTQWFISHQRKKTCPDCRSPVRSEPAPAYIIRNIVQIYTTRQELLDRGETTAEHAENLRVETEKIDTDKNRDNPDSKGLFQGSFKSAVHHGIPILDLTDGVERCPVCTWELEDDRCEHCGYARDYEYDDYFSDEDPEFEDFDHFAFNPRTEFDGPWREFVFPDRHGMLAPLRSNRGPRTVYDADSDESGEDDLNSEDMSSFIDDGDGDSHISSSDSTTSTVVGNAEYLTEESVNSSAADDNHPVIEILDSMSEGELEHTTNALFQGPDTGTVINDSEDDNDGDEDDEPIRSATMLARRRRRIPTSSPPNLRSDSPSGNSSSGNSSSSEGPQLYASRRGQRRRINENYETQDSSSDSDAQE